MPVQSFHAVFMRGGTSNGLVVHRHHLPEDVDDWQSILAAAMGSPDPYARQLDGMGSGVSSTSKVCVVEKSSRPEIADVDYTFVQVNVLDGTISLAGNCGNMSSAIGPFALGEGLVRAEREEATVRILNTNTNKGIVARFAVDHDGKFDPAGDYAIDGVPGSGSKIRLEFLDPAGAKLGKGALPTGNAIDVLKLSDGSEVHASLSDIANPAVFVSAEELGVPGDILPAALEEKKDVLKRLEEIRQAGAKLMGLDPSVKTIPFVAFVSRPTEATAKSGINITIRALSSQQAHKAVPLTVATNLGSTVRIAGTLPASLAIGVTEGGQSVTVGHPGGKLEVGGFVGEDGSIKCALLQRTARVMMKGEVFYNVKEKR